jgi:hypothetical protein
MSKKNKQLKKLADCMNDLVNVLEGISENLDKAASLSQKPENKFEKIRDSLLDEYKVVWEALSKS